MSRCACVNVCMLVEVCTRLHVCAYVHGDDCTPVCMHVYVCHTCVCACTCVHSCLHMSCLQVFAVITHGLMSVCCSVICGPDPFMGDH